MAISLLISKVGSDFYATLFLPTREDRHSEISLQGDDFESLQRRLRRAARDKGVRIPPLDQT